MEVPMAMGRPKAVLVLSPEQRAQLESMASSRFQALLARAPWRSARAAPDAGQTKTG